MKKIELNAAAKSGGVKYIIQPHKTSAKENPGTPPAKAQALLKKERDKA